MRTFKLLLMAMALLSMSQSYAQTCTGYVQPPNDPIQNGAMEYFWKPCNQLTVTQNGGPPWNFPYSCCFWTQPNGVGTTYCTPDYFNSCAPNPTTNAQAGSSVDDVLNWQNFNIGPVACNSTGSHGGNGFSGIAVWNSSTENREYISSQLVSALQPGWTYQVSMWVRLSPNSARGIQNLSAMFSTALPNQPVSGFFCTPLIPGATDVVVSMSSTTITDKVNWTHLTANITVPIGSNLNYITIGNLQSSAGTTLSSPLTVCNSQIGNQSYYYIDDVSMSVVNCAPYLEFAGSSYEICEGNTGSLVMQYPPGNFNMAITDLTNNTVIYNGVATSNFSVSPTTTTTYQVILTNQNNPGCSTTSYFTVTVLPGPDASFSPWFLGGSLQLQSGAPGTHNWEVWGSYTGNVGTYTYVGSYDYNYFALNAGVNCYFIRHTVTNDCGTDCKAMSVCNANCDWQPCGLQAPTNLYIDYSTYTFNWNPVAGADHYVIEIILDDPACCGDPSGPLSILNIRTITTYTNSHTLNYAADIGDAIWSCYSWRVLAVCPNGASTLSDPQCIGTGSHDHRNAPLDDNNINTESLTALRVYPNPTKGLTTFEIETGKDLEFGIEIFDINGKSIKTFSNIKSTGKRTLINWDTESFSKGTYLVRVTTSDHQIINSTLIVE
jgi:hypothetical protein